MMKKSISFVLRSVVLAGLAAAFAANAVQTVTPYTAGTGGTAISAANVAAGTTFTFFGRYELEAGSTGNESGLGLKVKYDKTKFSNVVVDQVYTKCMIASPDKQETVPATSQVVFGWIDTSVRRTSTVPNGVVGWPATADPAAPGATDGCLNPGGIVTTSAGDAPPLSLFRIQMTTEASFTSGTTNVNLASDGNYSYAGATPGFTNKQIVLTAAAAPTIALVSAGSRKVHSATTIDAAVTSINASAATAAAAAGAGISVEPRAPTSGGFSVVMNFSAAATSGTASIVSCVMWNGTAAVACAANPTIGAVTFSGSSAVIPLTGVTNQSRVMVRLAGVSGQSFDADATIGFLIGDMNSNGQVQGSDVLFVQQRLLQTPASANFVTSGHRADVNANGTVQGSDVLTVQQRLLTRLP